ncbi:MAG: hypothetical protein ACR2PT_02315 [Endozoicomonas sp.]
MSGFCSAYQCPDLPDSIYRKTIFSAIDEVVKTLRPNLVERLAKVGYYSFLCKGVTPLLLQRALSPDELKYAHMIGLLHIEKEPEAGSSPSAIQMLKLGDTIESAFYKLSRGDELAEEVLEKLVACFPREEPYKRLTYVAPLLYLDSYGIRGKRLIYFYESVCHKNVRCMIQYLNAVSLGKMSAHELRQHIFKKKRIDRDKMEKTMKSTDQEMERLIRNVGV